MPTRKNISGVHYTLDIQTPPEVRYLDPKNLPQKTKPQQVFWMSRDIFFFFKARHPPDLNLAGGFAYVSYSTRNLGKMKTC